MTCFDYSVMRERPPGLYELVTEMKASCKALIPAAAIRNLEDHPLIFATSKITLFVSGFQNRSVLHDDAESARKAKTFEKLFNRRLEQFVVAHLATKLSEASVFHTWFCVPHCSDPFEPTEPGHSPTVARRNLRSQQKCCSPQVTKVHVLLLEITQK